MQQMIAIDAAALDELKAELQRINRKLDAVHMEAPPRFITKADYAKKVGKSLDTVRRYIRNGELETSGSLVRNPDA